MSYSGTLSKRHNSSVEFMAGFQNKIILNSHLYARTSCHNKITPMSSSRRVHVEFTSGRPTSSTGETLVNHMTYK